MANILDFPLKTKKNYNVYLFLMIFTQSLLFGNAQRVQGCIHDTQISKPIPDSTIHPILTTLTVSYAGYNSKEIF